MGSSGTALDVADWRVAGRRAGWNSCAPSWDASTSVVVVERKSGGEELGVAAVE